jgi:hypothetical protein
MGILHVSQQWLETARHYGYGPPWVRLGPRLIAYPCGKFVDYLHERARLWGER